MGRRRNRRAEPAASNPTRARGRSRWLLRLAALLVAGAAILVWALREQPPPSLTFENRSGERITLLEVRIDGETRTFHDVPPGAEVGVSLAGKAGAAFVLKGQLAGGTLLNGGGKAGTFSHFIVLPGGQLQPRRADQGR